MFCLPGARFGERGRKPPNPCKNSVLRRPLLARLPLARAAPAAQGRIEEARDIGGWGRGDTRLQQFHNHGKSSLEFRLNRNELTYRRLPVICHVVRRVHTHVYSERCVTGFVCGSGCGLGNIKAAFVSQCVGLLALRFLTPDCGSIFKYVSQ